MTPVISYPRYPGLQRKDETTPSWGSTGLGSLDPGLPLRTLAPEGLLWDPLGFPSSLGVVGFETRRPYTCTHKLQSSLIVI